MAGIAVVPGARLPRDPDPGSAADRKSKVNGFEVIERRGITVPESLLDPPTPFRQNEPLGKQRKTSTNLCNFSILAGVSDIV